MQQSAAKTCRMWQTLICFCFLIHFVSTTLAQWEAIRAIVSRRVREKLLPKEIFPASASLTRGERNIFYAINASNVIFVLLVSWIALSHLKTELHSDTPIIPFIIGMALILLVVLSFYVSWKEKKIAESINLVEINPYLTLVFLGAELLAFNVIVAELAFQFIH